MPLLDLLPVWSDCAVPTMPQKLTPTTVPTSLLTFLGVAAFERLDDDRFVLCGPAPDWLDQHWPSLATMEPVALPEHFLFLAHFLGEEDAFADARAGTVHASGPWTEAADDGPDMLLEAFSIGLDEQDLLLLKPARIDQTRFRRVLQQSRDLSLEHYALRQSLDQREVLLHCLVHDLSTPLAGVRSSLSLLREDHAPQDASSVDDETHEVLVLALRQVEKAQRMLRDLLEAYTSAAHGGATLPDLYDTATETLALLRPVGKERGVRLELDAEPGEWHVTGERRRLERVLFNLVDNALRYAPAGSTVTVHLSQEDGAITCEVHDAGPGVAPEHVPRLFRKFEQGSRAAGAVGLGLYFCRITVEGWGGTIGYREAPSGGACFWFRLPADPSVPA